MHDVCSVCVNDCEVLNKGFDEVSDKALSGVTANLWWEAGSCFGKSGNTESGGLTPAT